MPFTPFHFGLGLAFRAGLPKHFCFLFFVALQVLTDLETLYNLMHDRYPLHRFLHTFVGASLLAGLSSIAVLGGLRIRRRPNRDASTGTRCATVLLTAFVATWSHVALDSVMHADTQPLFPFSPNNPFLGTVSVGTLHVVLVGLGVVGGLVLLLRAATNYLWRVER